MIDSGSAEVAEIEKQAVLLGLLLNQVTFLVLLALPDDVRKHASRVLALPVLGPSSLNAPVSDPGLLEVGEHAQNREKHSADRLRDASFSKRRGICGNRTGTP